ncbi:Hypothetical predicted protein [Cloeon dipterum]|uniref:UV-stimulated scaffold protein A C-terminal domain-containing protein n=1 Tax=Cloeon dipterum TaxID=197152 RepID=A0A8S1DPD9_9INSE|nr:Hypothetical predicted protein [Cloeon dipterum]
MDEFDEIFPNLLQKITHSGKKQLDHENIRKIEELISPSVKHCKQSHQHIMKHLEKKHAEVRFSTLLVCDHLVRFSKVFRKNLIGEDLTNFLELTMGTNKSRPLPPPKNVAKDLRSQAISIIYKWHEDFGKDFVELANAFYYLKDCIKVDFKAIEKQKIAEKLKAQMEKKRLEEKKEERMKKALVEFKSFFDEAQRLCTELENCISLLIPPPEDFFLPLNPADAINSEPGTSSDLRSHGIVTPGISIPIQVSKAVPKLVIDEDNQPIVENAQEIFSQLNKGHVKRVASWTEIFSDNRDHAGKFQSCKVLNEQLKKCLNQFEDLGLKKSRRGQSVSSEEEDFEEVEPKEGYEEKVKEDLLSVMIAKKEQKKEEKSEPNVKPVAKKPKIFEKPVEKVSTNIEDWEKKQLELPPVIVGIRPDNSQVWIGPSFEDEEVKVPVIESCPVDYSRTFEPVKWSCRAPLPNGTLCPRQDRIKVTFYSVYF